MVSARKPKSVVIPGGLGGQDMVTTARQAHGHIANKCIIDIYEIIERMAARTANPELFKKRMALHFNLPTCASDYSRRKQMEVALDKWKKFEHDFNAHLDANGYAKVLLPAGKIVSTVEQIAHTAWDRDSSMSIHEGWKRHPPDSA